MAERVLDPLVLGIGIVLALASHAAAAQKRSPAVPPSAATSGTPECRGANLFRCGPIYNGNDYLGQDPDPFIRLSIQRDLGARYGGGD